VYALVLVVRALAAGAQCLLPCLHPARALGCGMAAAQLRWKSHNSTQHTGWPRPIPRRALSMGLWVFAVWNAMIAHLHGFHGAQGELK